MLSFIVPAYNEEALLGPTLDTLLASARAVNVSFELIVVNDASTDRTAEIARARGARVVDVHFRQIAAVRNAGARVASGDVLVFLDADTLLSEAVLRAMLNALQAGAIGGGALAVFDLKMPRRARLMGWIFLSIWFRILRWAAGCFVFARRKDFESAGGFDERYFIGEEMNLSRALKRVGRFTILKTPVITSGRKARMYSFHQLFWTFSRLLWRGPKAWRCRKGLDLWYGGTRE